ncbi:MAG: hypothetical protein K6T16_00830 [Candidatus Pacearchaeota archaeon]|nr:hypothetical protein [Candidatus Pacearchaeota archaeon]
MSFQTILKRLKESSEFKRFKRKHRNIFLFSAFFVLKPDFETDTQQLDYFLEKNKAATFYIDRDIKHKIDEFSPQSNITALNERIKIDLKDLREIIKNELENKSLKESEVNKIIAILQKVNNRQMWNVTCMLTSLKILQLHIDCFTGEVIESKQGSIFDFIQVKK